MAQSQDEKDTIRQLNDAESNSPTELSSCEFINASGHIQEAHRNFGLLSLTGFGIVNGNVWPALGGTVLVAIFNGGPPGTIYGFIAVSIFYWIVAACIGIFFIILGGFITIVVCAALPGHGGRPGHASDAFMWRDWKADVEYHDGFVFLAGMLNGAYAVGTPDLAAHLSEEIPRPHVNVLKAIGLAMGAGFLTAFLYLIAIFYSIHELVALSSSAFPIAEIYAQATGSPAGAIGLLFLLLLSSVLTVVGSYITIGRGLWTLARDRATPFSDFLSKESPALGMPFNATIACAILNTLLGCLYLGNTTAFGALVGSVATLTTASYTAAILPNLLTGRKNIRFGPFHVKGWLGFVMNGVACTYMIVFFITFCFPYHLPSNAKSMNYSSLISGGMTIFVTAWYFLGGRKGYKGPRQSEARSTKQT